MRTTDLYDYTQKNEIIMDSIMYSLFVSFKSLFLFFMNQSLQLIIFLIIYLIGVFSVKDGLTTSMVAVAPLALFLSFTLSGILILMYFSLISPVYCLYLSINRARLLWEYRAKVVDENAENSTTPSSKALELNQEVEKKFARKMLIVAAFNGIAMSTGMLLFVF